MTYLRTDLAEKDTAPKKSAAASDRRPIRRDCHSTIGPASRPSHPPRSVTSASVATPGGQHRFGPQRQVLEPGQRPPNLGRRLIDTHRTTNAYRRPTVASTSSSLVDLRCVQLDRALAAAQPGTTIAEPIVATSRPAVGRDLCFYAAT